MRLQFEKLWLNIVAFLGTNFEGSPVILMKMMDTSLKSAYEQAVADPGGFQGFHGNPLLKFIYSIKRLLREEHKIDDLFLFFFWSSTQTGLVFCQAETPF